MPKFNLLALVSLFLLLVLPNVEKALISLFEPSESVLLMLALGIQRPGLIIFGLGFEGLGRGSPIKLRSK